VDVQLRGPYAQWEHTHTLVQEGENTQMIDDVEYRLPFGSFGQLVAGWLVARQLKEVFNYRREQIDKLLNT
jgi:ligand-binding SRPBCC domain-containing protein